MLLLANCFDLHVPLKFDSGLSIDFSLVLIIEDQDQRGPHCMIVLCVANFRNLERVDPPWFQRTDIAASK